MSPRIDYTPGPGRDFAPFQYRYTTGGGRWDCWIADHDAPTVFYSRPGTINHHPLPYAISEAWFLCWPDSEGCA
jgi:hypothetical protein